MAKPEVLLAAARIADKNQAWMLVQGGAVMCWVEEVPCEFDLKDGDDKCALREALDKEYGIVIRWYPDVSKWLSIVMPWVNSSDPMPTMFDDDITNLMLRNVEALMDLGVLDD